MAIIEHSIRINASCEDVYRISQDYKIRFDWDPFPDRLEMIGGDSYTAEQHKQVLVRSKLGMSMVVEFVQVTPPTCAAIVMVSGPWFLKKFAGSWTFAASTPGHTIAKFRYSIQAKPAILRKIIENLATLYFHRATRKRLIKLKEYCESKLGA